jgi:hypothetical protein
VMTLRPDLLVAGASAATVAACLAIAVVPAAVVGAAAVAGMCILGPLIAVPLETRLYALVPDDWTGRVQGGFFLIGGSIYPLGSLVMGVLLAHGPVRLGYEFFAGVLAAVLVLTVTPAFRHQLIALGQAGPQTLPATTAAPPPNSPEERHAQPASAQHAH